MCCRARAVVEQEGLSLSDPSAHTTTTIMTMRSRACVARGACARCGHLAHKGQDGLEISKWISAQHCLLALARHSTTRLDHAVVVAVGRSPQTPSILMFARTVFLDNSRVATSWHSQSDPSGALCGLCSVTENEEVLWRPVQMGLGICAISIVVCSIDATTKYFVSLSIAAAS